MKMKKVVIKPTSETPVPQGMKYQEYYVSEEVDYQRTLFVPVNATEEEIFDLVEKDWEENGDPLKDCVGINEREFDIT